MDSPVEENMEEKIIPISLARKVEKKFIPQKGARRGKKAPLTQETIIILKKEPPRSEQSEKSIQNPLSTEEWNLLIDGIRKNAMTDYHNEITTLKRQLEQSYNMYIKSIENTKDVCGLCLNCKILFKHNMLFTCESCFNEPQNKSQKYCETCKDIFLIEDKANELILCRECYKAEF